MGGGAIFYRAVLVALANEDNDREFLRALEALSDDEVVEAGRATVDAVLEPLAEHVGRAAAVAVNAYREHLG